VTNAFDHLYIFRGLKEKGFAAFSVHLNRFSRANIIQKVSSFFGLSPFTVIIPGRGLKDPIVTGPSNPWSISTREHG